MISLPSFQRLPLQRMSRVVLPFAVLALVGALLLHPGQSQTNPPSGAVAAVQVRTSRVQEQTVPMTQSGTGTVLPFASVTVRTRVDGQLNAVFYGEGQMVKAGQLLARIDPRIYEAQLAQALAQKAKDQVLLANAQVDLQRDQQLIKDDAVTQQTLDTQTALVAQLQAALQSDAAQVSLARVQLDYTTITSPINGRTGARLVDAGNIVHAADPGGLVVINQMDPIAVQFTLPEAGFQEIHSALRASKKPLKVEALDELTNRVLAQGDLTMVNNQIDTATGTVVLKARFANADSLLWPGQSVHARITLGERQHALIVPTTAVQRSQQGYFVYVVDAQDVVHIQAVQIVQQLGDTMVVGTGLVQGDRVVVDGQYRLTPGAHVVELQAAKGAKS